MIEEGMIIKTFPDTDIRAYTRMIQESGYRPVVGSDYIRVGKPYLYNKIKPRDFAKLLRDKRKAKGITREELGKMVGVSYQSVFDWEVGRRTPRHETLKKLKFILDISEGELECLTKKQ